MTKQGEGSAANAGKLMDARSDKARECVYCPSLVHSRCLV